MIVVSVPDDWYGSRTATMRQIVGRASRIAWFVREPDGGRLREAARLVARHIECLHAIDYDPDRPLSLRPTILRGRWRTLHKGIWGVTPYDPWGPDWEGSSISVGRVIQMVRRRVDATAKARGMLRAPLWPIVPQANVCGGAFVADRERRKQVQRLIPDARDRCVAWALLCEAESRIWNALLWELAISAGVVEGVNPFEPLIELYELGYFPMGWHRGSYDLFVVELLKDEGDGFAVPGERGENYLSW